MPQTSDSPEFPVLELLAFADSTTAVLGGVGLSEIDEGDELYVLGISEANIPKLNVPLVVPKASLEVTANAGVYILAKSPKLEVLVPSPLFGGALASMLGDTVRTLERMDISKDREQFLGNPGRGYAKVGDVVVQKSDLAKYISWLKKQNDARS
jgi:hypothetical protein